MILFMIVSTGNRCKSNHLVGGVGVGGGGGVVVVVVVVVVLLLVSGWVFGGWLTKKFNFIFENGR